MPRVVDLNFELNPKAKAFFLSKAPEKCISGGFGSGKTLVFCLDLVTNLTGRPREVAIVARADYGELVDTVLPVLFEGTGDTPPVLYPGTYIYRKSEKTIRLIGGGLIRLRSLGKSLQSDLDRMGRRGATVTRVYIDQAEEISERQYMNIRGRIRAKGKGLERQTVINCNPASQHHWIAKRFGFAGDEPQPGTFGVSVGTFENAKHLTPDYLALVDSYTGIMRRRYVMAEWCGSDHLVYDNFSREAHVKPAPETAERVFVALDDAGSSTTSIGLWFVVGNRKWKKREVYRAGMKNSEKMDVVQTWAREFDIEGVVVDSAAYAIKQDLAAAGFSVINSPKGTEEGVKIVRNELDPGPDGLPMILIDPACKRTIAELETYEYDPKTGKPVKANDHACDEMRYLVVHLATPVPRAFDLDGLRPIEATAKATDPIATGKLNHELPEGLEQDRAISRALAGDGPDRVAFEPDRPGTKTRSALTLWTTLSRGRPRDQTLYALAVSCGDPECPSVVTVADSVTGAVVMEWTKTTTPEKLARLVSVLSVWCRGVDAQPARIGVYCNDPGRVLVQRLHQFGAVVSIQWAPNADERADWLGLLRGAWESRRLVEPQPLAIAEARQYVYVAGTLMHSALTHQVHRRETWADRVLSRALLWKVLQTMPSLPITVHPLNPLTRRAAMEAAEAEEV